MQSGKQQFFKRIPPMAVSLLYGFAGFVLVYLILFNVVSPMQYELTVGEIASSTITATKEIQDEVTTQQNIAYARSQVESILRLDDTVTESVLMAVQENLQTTQQYHSRYQDLIKLYQLPEMDVYLPPVSLLDEFSEELSVSHSLNRDQLSAILQVSESRLAGFGSALLQVIDERMSVGVRETELSTVRTQMMRDIQSAYYSVDQALLPLAQALINGCVTENLFYDEAATEAARLEAEASVVPVIYKKGQNIVVENEIVTQAQYEVVSNLGLLHDDNIDLNLYLGLALVVLLVFASVYVYLYSMERALLETPRMVLLIFTIYLLVIGMGLLMRQVSIYLIPLQLGVFLMATLIDRKLAIIGNASLAILVGILTTGEDGLLALGMFNILLVAVITGSLSVALTKVAKQRMSLIYTGFLVSLMNFATMFGIGLMTMSSVWEIVVAALAFAGSGLLSAFLAIGFSPILESLFSVVTPQKLMELADANHPLLRKLQMEAPGTYQHSLIVANLAEAAAQAIGANDLLARVGAYYHDVGKLKRPYMFKENQLGAENPHDHMDPYVSAAVITAHTRDGLQMAKKYKLPKCITDIICQHHGKGTATYFYYEACKRAQETGAVVDIADFSYEGPWPETAEAAIISMADTMEAAVRSMKKHSREEIEKMVNKLVASSLQDGRLQNAPLTLAQLNKVSEAFVFTLSGFYHDRVEYPDAKEVGAGAPKPAVDAESAAKPENVEKPQGDETPEKKAEE